MSKFCSKFELKVKSGFVACLLKGWNDKHLCSKVGTEKESDPLDR